MPSDPNETKVCEEEYKAFTLLILLCGLPVELLYLILVFWHSVI